jgi:hypothetical protein
MTTFDSTKTELSKLLEEVVLGKIQLPDFQRDGFGTTNIFALSWLVSTALLLLGQSCCLKPSPVGRFISSLRTKNDFAYAY